MTKAERKAMRLIQGGLELLRNAIVYRDPSHELERRARDLLADVRAVTAGKAATVAAFPKPKK